MSTANEIVEELKFPTEVQLLTYYMEDVMEEESTDNIYKFCKKHGIQETAFYAHFSSIEQLKQQIWVTFFTNATETLTADTSFAGYNDTNKLVSLYFTLFEVFTLNRSYITCVLPNTLEALKNVNQLKGLRSSFKTFINESLNHKSPSFIPDQLSSFTQPLVNESYWVQFLFILQFWLNDTSKGFEKTDVLIEKLIHTSQELSNSKPMESLVDLGKFLWKTKR
jgi:hypothetical protein